MERSEDCHVEEYERRVTPEERAMVTVTRLSITGMGCPNCATRVRNSILRLKGVVGATVDLLPGVGFVYFNPTFLSDEQLIEAVAAAGRDGRHRYIAQIVP